MKTSIKTSEIFHKHRLSDGSAIWLQKTKIPGVRKPTWTVVQSTVELLEAPTLTDVADSDEGANMIADLLRADVLETEAV